MSVPPRVLVAVPTCHRVLLLAGALDGVLTEAVRAVGAGGAAEVDVLVVDNDPAASAAVTSARYGARHVTEPVPGLSAVRNRALDEAAEYDLLVFLDDDEVPQAGWLTALLTVHRTTGAAAVAGPVRTVLPAEADAWVRASYCRPFRAHLQHMAVAATNNLLLDLRAVRASGVRFDPAFGLTGGEDNQFTSDLVRRGRDIRWCAGAGVVERVGPERLTRRWILRRALRAGACEARVALRATGSRRARVVRGSTLVVGGVGRLAVGAAGYAVAAVLGDLGRAARAGRTAARGAGRLAGVAGVRLAEYERRHAAGSGQGRSLTVVP